MKTLQTKKSEAPKELIRLLNGLSASNLESSFKRLIFIQNADGDKTSFDTLLNCSIKCVENLEGGFHVLILYLSAIFALLFHFNSSNSMIILLRSRLYKYFLSKFDRANSVIFGCYLYRLSVISDIEIAQIVKTIVQKNAKIDPILILNIFRHCGQDLNRKDPAIFLDLIEFIHQQAKELEVSRDFKWRFLIDSLQDIPSKKSKLRIDNRDFMIVFDIMNQIKCSADHASFTLSTNRLLQSTNNLDRRNRSVINDLADGLKLTSSTRKSILSILLSSDSLGICFESLLRLIDSNRSLFNIEVPIVLSRCCSAEANYNTFYAKLSIRLLKHDHRLRNSYYRLLYSFIDEVKKEGVSNIYNMGRFFAEIVVEQCLDAYKVLKKLHEFTSSTKTRLFYQIMVSNMLEKSNEVSKIWEFLMKESCQPDFSQVFFKFLNIYIIKRVDQIPQLQRRDFVLNCASDLVTKLENKTI